MSWNRVKRIDIIVEETSGGLRVRNMTWLEWHDVPEHFRNIYCQHWGLVWHFGFNLLIFCFTWCFLS